MPNHSYTLEKGSKKYTCPNCGHHKKFRKYIDTINNIYLADNVGICDRADSCGYHYPPKQYFGDHPDSGSLSPSNFRIQRPIQINVQPVDCLPFDLMEQSVALHEGCNLFAYFEKLFHKDVAKQVCETYHIGANKYGDTVFWQVAVNGEVRQSKVIRYDPQTGKRNKTTGVNFVGKKILASSDANLRQCFFGEHLLSVKGNESKKIGIVESEKTAAIASVYYPDKIWLATGGKNGCKFTESNVCKVLVGRKVVLFPDANQYDYWNEKGKLLVTAASCSVITSKKLHDDATDQQRQEDWDLADYLLRNQDGSGMALTDAGYPVIWDLKKQLTIKATHPEPTPEPTPEPEQEEEATTYSIEQLQAMVLRHFANSSIKNKQTNKGKYLELWCIDMSEFIRAVGVTKKNFIARVMALQQANSI